MYSSNISVEVEEFYDSPHDEILWSDFIISRAGALSLSEAVTLKRGSVIIPLPSKAIVAPKRGSLVVLSITVPLILVWLKLVEPINKQHKRKNDCFIV